MALKIGLNPIADKCSRILILGTLPGDQSLQFNEYYANPQNEFWKILSLVYKENIDLHYKSRLSFLFCKGIALWDMLHSAKRFGSLDSRIKGERPNNFSGFFEEHSQIEAIGFNGVAAEKLFKKHFLASIDSIVMKEKIKRKKVLPSTSSTPGKYVKSLDQKVAIWHDFLLG